MENFDVSKEQNRKQNKTFAIILILMLISIIFILSVLFASFLKGPTIKEDEGNKTYTVKDIRRNYSRNEKYWAIQVGRDIPSGYYNITGSSKADYSPLHFYFDYPSEIFLEQVDKSNIDKEIIEAFDDFNTSFSSYSSNITMDEDNNYHYVDNIFLPKGAKIVLDSSDIQDVTLKYLEKPNELDPKDISKSGVYETSNKKIDIPLHIEYNNLSLSNLYEIYTFSNDKIIYYECRIDTCNYSSYDLNNKEKKTKEVVLEDELGKESKNLTLDLLDRSVIKISYSH